MGMGRRGWCAVAAAIALFCLASGCASGQLLLSEASTTAGTPLSLVALGDSVPSGAACHCTPYPQLDADALTASSGRLVTATNDAVGGATTSSVLRQLDSNSTVIDHVSTADVIEIEIGANDIGFTSTCGTTVACYAPKIPTIQKNLDDIVSRVDALASGHKALVVLLDYWNVWLGGEYAAARGDAYVNAAEQMTDEVNSVIKATAAESGSAYVDVRAAFEGPTYAYDETRYLASDGDHPNAAGHKRIAAAAEAAIEKTLHL